MSFLRKPSRSGYGGARSLVNGLVAALVVAVPLAAAAAPIRILALGDSITAGYGLPQDQALPVRLEARIKADGFAVEIVNAGVSGDTTAGGAARLDWVLADHPQFALVELGANDALRGLNPIEVYANLDRILARLKEAHVKTLLLGMRAPGNWGKAYQRAFDAIYPRLAQKYDVPLYPFVLDGVALDPALNQGDGLHPNEKGVAFIVQKLAPMVEEMLKGAPKED
jgi:acyl-CoA thioesterase-1